MQTHLHPLVFLLIGWLIFIFIVIYYTDSNKKETCGKVIDKFIEVKCGCTRYYLILDFKNRLDVQYQCTENEFNNIIVDSIEPRTFCY